MNSCEASQSSRSRHCFWLIIKAHDSLRSWYLWSTAFSKSVQTKLSDALLRCNRYLNRNSFLYDESCHDSSCTMNYSWSRRRQSLVAQSLDKIRNFLVYLNDVGIIIIMILKTSCKVWASFAFFHSKMRKEKKKWKDLLLISQSEPTGIVCWWFLEGNRAWVLKCLNLNHPRSVMFLRVHHIGRCLQEAFKWV